MLSVIGSDASLTRQTIGSGATVLTVVLTMLLGSVGHASADDGRRIAWGLTSCDAVIAMIPVDRGVLEDVVPEGFTVGVPESVRVQLPPDPRVEAVFGLEVLRCASGTGLRGGVAGMTYASYWTFAEPPAELRKPGYDLSFVKWDTLIPDDDRRAVLVDHGIPARDGEVSFDVFHPDGSTVGALGSGGAAGPAGVTFDVSLRFADGEMSRFTGTGTIETDFQGSFIEYTPTDAGLASWTTNYRSRTADAGTGFVRLDPDGFPARIVGASVAQAYFLVATGVYFTGGTISLPPEMHSGTSEAPPGSSSVAGDLHRDAAECRDTRETIWWKAMLETGRDCVTGPAETAAVVTDATTDQVESCLDAGTAMWWEITSEVRRRCVDRPVRAVVGWGGLGPAGVTPSGGVIP